MRHTRRKERDGLDLARPAPRRRHKTLRQLCALLLGLAGLALLSMAVWGAALPRRLDDALAQHYAAQMSVMQRELFALRRRLAEHEPDAEENAALRNFLQSRQTDGERWDSVWTATRWPGGFLLAQPGQAGGRSRPCWTAAAVLRALQGSMARCPRRAAERGQSRLWWGRPLAR